LDSWNIGIYDGIAQCMGAPETYQRKPKIKHLPWRENTFADGPMKIYGLTQERIAETLEKYGKRARFIPTDAEVDFMTVPGYDALYDGNPNIDPVEPF